MPKDPTSAVQMFLEGTEGDDNLFPTQDDTFTHQPEPSDPEPAAPVDDKPLPFHKDPKIQKYLDRREREIEERIRSSMSSQNAATPQTPTADRFQKVISSFEGIIGNDTPEKVSALNSLKDALLDMDANAVRVAEQKINEIRDRDLQAEQEAEQELEQAFENIEDTFDVDLTSPKAAKVRQDFVTFIEKIAPKDSRGNIVDYPDMTSAWETFSEMRRATQQPSRAKDLAARTIKHSTETAPTAQRRVDWNAVEDMVDKL